MVDICEYSQQTKYQPPTLPRNDLNENFGHTNGMNGRTKPLIGAASLHKKKIDALTALLAHKLQFKHKNRVASVSQFQQI